MDIWHLVAHEEEIAEGFPVNVTVEGRALLLCKVEGQIYCLEDRCSHRDIPMNQGWLEGHEMVCPLHGGSFDIRDGQPCKLPATKPIQHYTTKIEEQQVYVALP